MSFVKTEKQSEALDVANSVRHAMLYGGSRSGKTTILVRNVFLRAIKKPSKHLIVRFRYNHARVSLGHETIPKVLQLCFKDLPVVENKADGYWTVPTVGGGESQVWLGGTDDKERIEKVLGSEYSTIYANECSQIPFNAITTLWTRLAETSGLSQRFYYDCNPTGKKHWTYGMFMSGTLPDGTKHGLEVGHCQLNPFDNLQNLTEEYIKALKGLPKRQRQRFLDGLYLSDVEGALWTDQMITGALLREPEDFIKTVVAVDPSVTNNPTSDECGIVVVSKDASGRACVRDDRSVKSSTKKWARRAVDSYRLYEASEIVAEVNQGGDLVEDAIHNIDPKIKVKKVRAATGKFARAEPVAHLYELGQVSHSKEMPELESEMTETVFDENLKKSPNRLDAAVWGITHLVIGLQPARIHVG